MSEVTNEELKHQIDQLTALSNHLQTQLQSQKFIIRALLVTSSNAEEIGEQYQQLLDGYEQSTGKLLPNLLVSC